MAKITLGGNPVETQGELPALGSQAPDFQLSAADLSLKQLKDYSGNKLVLNIFPSVDTNVCAASVRRFNEEAASLSDVKVLNISKDLPFAMKRFCGAEGIDRVENLSEFRNQYFAEGYQVTMTTGALAGLFSRAVVVVDENGKVIYTEQVPEIGQEPNYEAALEALVQ